MCGIGSAEQPKGQYQSWNGGWTWSHGTANACDPGGDSRGSDVPRGSFRRHRLANGLGLDRSRTEPLGEGVWALIHPWMTERREGALKVECREGRAEEKNVRGTVGRGIQSSSCVCLAYIRRWQAARGPSEDQLVGLVRHTIPVQGKGNGAVASMNHCRKQVCVAICLQ